MAVVDALGEHKAAEVRLKKAVEAAQAKKKELLAAQEAVATLLRRGGLGLGRTAPRPAAELQKAQQAVDAAAAAVSTAATEERRLLLEVRDARAKAAFENPSLFGPPKVEVAAVTQPTAATGFSDDRQALEKPVEAPNRKKVGLLFPGQGSQYVKMMSMLIENPEVKKLCERARKILGWDPIEVCIEGPEDKLVETATCQPCLFLASMAGMIKLRSENPEVADNPYAVAGLSLGEYSALCAAGVFTFEEGLELVRVRGLAMAEAASLQPQLMLSVFGIDQETMEKLCQAEVKPGQVCQIANLLFPRGFSCSGTADAINNLKDTVVEAGAMQAKLLKVEGAFHTSLMKPAQTKLQDALDRILPNMQPPTCDVYLNVTGKKVPKGTPPSEFIDLLGKQLCSTVLWEASVRLMIEDGLSEFYEVGPMKQLKAMMKRTDMDAWKNMYNIEV
mmetsp:Transcript_52208/g.114433  ORF Transcript_52208/g.114433 Transcript_52208/m.114433 type:complete len:447 (+) Transcript_52208:56-1396(+)